MTAMTVALAAAARHLFSMRYGGGSPRSRQKEMAVLAPCSATLTSMIVRACPGAAPCTRTPKSPGAPT